MALNKDQTVLSVTTVGGVTAQGTAATYVDGSAATPKIATAVPNGDINLITITTANDALTLPANLPKGTIVYLVNISANAGVLFPAVGGAINGGSVNASVALPASKTTILFVTDQANNARVSVAGF